MPPAGHKEGSGVDEAEAEVLELLVMDMPELVEVGSETLKLLLDELVPIGKGGAVPWPPVVPLQYRATQPEYSPALVALHPEAIQLLTRELS